jgi:hypothetical protein
MWKLPHQLSDKTAIALTYCQHTLCISQMIDQIEPTLLQ